MAEDDYRQEQRDLEWNEAGLLSEIFQFAEEQDSHKRFSTPPIQDGVLGTPMFLGTSPAAPQTPDHPPSPLVIRSKHKLKRTRDEVIKTVDYKEREGTPSKRLQIAGLRMDSVQGEKEKPKAGLSRNDKAQGLRESNIIEQRTRRGKKK